MPIIVRIVLFEVVLPSAEVFTLLSAILVVMACGTG